MNELQEIEVLIDTNGEVRIDVMGAKGGQCLELTREMEELLGNVVLERNFTGEFDEQVEHDHQEQRQNTRN